MYIYRNSQLAEILLVTLFPAKVIRPIELHKKSLYTVQYAIGMAPAYTSLQLAIGLLAHRQQLIHSLLYNVSHRNLIIVSCSM